MSYGLVVPVVTRYDRWRVETISYFLLALAQRFFSFFAPFLHFPVTGVSGLVG